MKPAAQSQVVEVQLNEEDLRAFSAYMHKYRAQKKSLKPFSLYYLFGLLICVGAAVLFSIYSAQLESVIFPYGWGIAVTLAWMFWCSHVQKKRAGVRPFDSIHYKTYEYSVTAEGIRKTSKVSDGCFFWRGIASIDETKDYIFIILEDRDNAFIIPARSFTSDAQRKEFTQTCRQFFTRP